MKRVSTPALAVVVLALVALLALVGVAGVFVSLQATNRHQRDTNRHIIATAYSASIRRWHQAQYGCGRAVSDRQLLLRQAKASRRAALAIADDRQTGTTARTARRLEAQAFKREIHGFRLRVPPQFSCARAYPKPDTPQGIGLLP